MLTKARWLMWWTLSTYAISALFEEVIGYGSPFPRPIKEFNEAESRGVNPYTKLAGEIAEPLPLAGGLKYGSHPGGPIAELGAQVFSKLGGRKGAGQKPWAAIAGTALGVPGTAEMLRQHNRAKRKKDDVIPWTTDTQMPDLGKDPLDLYKRMLK